MSGTNVFREGCNHSSAFELDCPDCVREARTTIARLTSELEAANKARMQAEVVTEAAVNSVRAARRDRDEAVRLLRAQGDLGHVDTVRFLAEYHRKLPTKEPT